MASDYDATEFIDGDFEAHKSPAAALSAGSFSSERAPTREEVDLRVAETQQRLTEKKRELEELERRRAGLEETRRRQTEFGAGRQEMIQHLTRGVGLLQEAEFNARRDAEQMSKVLAGLQESLTKVQALHEEGWSRENFDVELTRALTTLENARMEWNSARLKFPLLSGAAQEDGADASGSGGPPPSFFETHTFGELCRLGFAFTWPVAGVLLAALATVLVILLRR
jgi:hypothetical protein